MTAQLPLFLRQIERVHELVDGSPVQVQNSSEATYCIDASGRHWVRKKVERTGFNELLAESIAWLLANKLGLPVPHAAVASIDSELSWLSELISPVVHWAPGYGHFVTNADDLGGVLALDAILMNHDRHAGNILLQPQPDETHLKAWSIDFGDSLVGWPNDFADLAPDALPSTGNFVRGMPVEIVAKGADKFAKSLSGLPTSVIKELVSEACELVGEPSTGLLAAKLASRCASAVGLVERYLFDIGKT